MRTFFLSIVVAAAAFFAVGQRQHVTAAEKQIHWIYSYEQALEKSKEIGKPIVLVFTGSNWCPACVRLEREILDKPSFSNELGNDFIFVKLEFNSSGSATHSKFKQEHETLLEKYTVRHFPNVVVVNSSETILMRTGYQPGGPEKYAAHLRTAFASAKAVE